MLDQDTKRRIDACRDVLVGKIPDPKSQVEQITIALIYKFMDDMDKQSIEMGGVATFFKDGYTQYSWTNMFSPSIGGHELVKLYGEAIEKMNQNPYIPQLFRDIFKNAYLPYRDPETLKLFLKEISAFSYSHSEKLGDAFEYLLSFMGTQGDAGQFRTPRHIIDFIAAVVNPQKHETVLDPACGTAGFLISAYKHIVKSNDNGDKLTPTERKRLLTNFVGYDISPDMVRLSLVNLYLHGFQDPKIFEYDTLSSEDRWNDTVDVILANPPFMTPRGGIRPHKRFSVQANRSEVLFVDYIAEHLNPGGRAGVIVPEGIIFQSSNAYKNLRKMLVENYLWAVVSLPAGVFQPYSGVKTSILFMDKTKAKQNDSILFVKVERDGFGLGAQRRPIDKDDIPEAVKILQSENTNNTELAHWVEKSKIAESDDWNLSGERYRESILIKTNYVNVILNDICDVRDGTHDSPKYQLEGYPLITSKNIKNNIIDFSNTNFISKADLDLINKRSFVDDGDILMPMIGTIGNPIIVNKDREFAIKNVALIKFYEDSRIERKFLKNILASQVLENQYISHSSGSTQKFISLKFIRGLQIPLPPLSVQEEIVAEIDGYQKIINGARMVVDNYKPTIKIDPDWELMKLGDVMGKSSYSINPQSQSGDIKYVGLENIEQNTGSIVGELDTEISTIRSTKLVFKEGNILYGKLRPNLNKVHYCSFEGICSTDIFVLNCDKEKANPVFYSIYLRSDSFNSDVLKGLSGAQLPRVRWNYFSSLIVPLPPVPAQKKIVAQIESEQEMVNANKKLIEIYEQKIKDKISEVWGSD